MSSLSIGLSGISVNQTMMDLIGQNLTNASDPAYHRQDATLAARVFGTASGDGVQVSQVRRLISDALETAIRANTATLGDTNRQLQTLQQLQSYLAPGNSTGSLQNLLETFFNQAQQLTLQPDNLTQRGVLLTTGQELAQQLNGTAAQFSQAGTDLMNQGQQTVTQVNQLATQIAQLNAKILAATVQNTSPNDLEDQRDALIGQLAQHVDVRTLDGGHGQTNVFVGGYPLVMGDQAVSLTLGVDSGNQAVLTQQGSSAPITVSGGDLGAVLALRNGVLPELQGQLSTFTNALVRALNGIQAQGLGLSGPLTSLGGQNGVTSTTAPLAQAGLTAAPQAGTLSISVTDLATGRRALHQVSIDPATQSLQAVAAAISAIPNLQAVVNNQTGTLTILAQPGFAFDFAGRLSTTPDTQAITGSATVQVSGSYTGSANDAFTYQVVGGGQVGVSTNLALEVRNAAGTLLNTFNIGQGYQPGAALPAVDGVTVALSAGTVNAGDTFTVDAVANPDTAGLTTALGLGTFFTGDGAGGIQVNPDLLSDPGKLALSATGTPGDGTNLQRLIALRDQPLLAGGTKTLSDYLAGLVGDVAGRVNDLTTRQTTQQSVGQSLTAQQQSISGVDPNEELVRLLQYQRGFQMSAHYISVVNSTVDDLLHIVT